MRRSPGQSDSATAALNGAGVKAALALTGHTITRMTEYQVHVSDDAGHMREAAERVVGRRQGAA
jgi:hypothetical protein